MKHIRHMSLIARRAQIRRAAAHRKDLAPAKAAGRPVLRLVASGGVKVGEPAQDERPEADPAADPAAARQRPFSP
jgi:hypothetical protein